MNPRTAGPVLIADIGGTHARFALADGEGGWGGLSVVGTRDHAELVEALRSYLGAKGATVRRAVIAGAGPVDGDRIDMTNCPWTIDRRELVSVFALDACRLVNDFEALAYALPRFRDEHVVPLGPRVTAGSGPRLILGPGTGFGASIHVATAGGGVVIPTEGGHLALAISDVPGAEILGPDEHYWGRMTNEGILSGSGILRLHGAACREAGNRTALDTPAAVVEAAERGDPAANRAIDLFCSLLGAAAADLALATGARGGVYVAGGIAPRLLDRLRSGSFRDRFDAKAPMTDYVRAIPTFVVVAPQPAMIGLAGLARQIATGG